MKKYLKLIIMLSQKYPVPIHLQPFIKSYMTIEVDIKKADVRIPAISSCYLMFHYGDTFNMVVKGKTAKFMPVALSGITTSFSTFEKDKVRVRCLGAELQPFTPYLLIGKKVSSLTNATMDGSQIFENTTNTYKEIVKAISIEERIDILNVFFTKLFAKVERPQFDLEIAVNIMSNPEEFEIIDSKLNKIDQNMSERNFRRKFKYTLGVSPKLYMRIMRMEAVLKEFYSNPDLDYLAKAYGFWDQSHLIRECKSFSGRTPNQIIKILHNQKIRKYHTHLSS